MSEIGDHVSLNLTIMDKEYCIACPLGEKDALIQSVRIVNNQIQNLRQSGKVVGNERLAVMAALCIANELIQHRKKEKLTSEQINFRIHQIQERISAAIIEQQELFLT